MFQIETVGDATAVESAHSTTRLHAAARVLRSAAQRAIHVDTTRHASYVRRIHRFGGFMKTRLFLALGLVLAALAGCAAPVESENTAEAEQAVTAYNDPSAIVAEINTNGATYSAQHLDLAGTAEWAHFDSGTATFSIVQSSDLRFQIGVYNQFVGAVVDTDPLSETYHCIHTASDTYWQVYASGGYVRLAAP